MQKGNAEVVNDPGKINTKHEKMPLLKQIEECDKISLDVSIKVNFGIFKEDVR